MYAHPGLQLEKAGLHHPKLLFVRLIQKMAIKLDNSGQLTTLSNNKLTGSLSVFVRKSDRIKRVSIYVSLFLNVNAIFLEFQIPSQLLQAINELVTANASQTTNGPVRIEVLPRRADQRFRTSGFGSRVPKSR